MSKGIVYVLTNEGMPDLVKIGKTGDINRRLDDLYNTSVPFPFKCEYAVECDMDYVERKLHDDIFYDERVNPKREFFRVPAEKVVGVLSLVGRNVTEEMNDALNKDMDDTDKGLIGEGRVFFLKARGCFGTMSISDGRYILKKGSWLRSDCVPSFRNFTYYEKRLEIMENSTTITDGKVILTEDIECTSASMAGSIVAGRSCNGYSDWKTQDGTPLDRIR